MPRARRIGGPEPKTRSRLGCWPCKSRKIKCGEEKPRCLNCERQGETCDYSIRLNWDGRARKKNEATTPDSGGSVGSPSHSPLAPTRSPQFAFWAPTSHPPAFVTRRSDPTGTHQPRPDLSRQASQPVHSQHTSGIASFPSRLSSPGQQQVEAVAKGRQSLSPNFQMMQPPYQVSNESRAYSQQIDLGLGVEHRRKRLKMEDVAASPLTDFTFASNSSRSHQSSAPSTPYDTTQTYSNLSEASGNSPAVPASNFARISNGSHVKPALAPLATTSNPSFTDLRRLSVRSLLASPVDGQLGGFPVGFTTYGYDQGRDDLDLPKNDDGNALSVYSPTRTFRRLSSIDFPFGRRDDYPTDSEGGSRTKEEHFEKGGYYAEPIAIKIPYLLEPLPSMLLDNPMNLLYFHHFLNHTAKLLVPHDCPENPFRNILPQMAVRDDNLLNLLLAYAASHRARLLSHPEPATRIALWVRDVFPNLRHVLTNSHESISDANLATAIMLASLEVISPNAFEVNISWQEHLGLAKQLILARGYSKLRRQEKVSYFLIRWFAYLDVLGRLSGGPYAGGSGAFRSLLTGDIYGTSNGSESSDEVEIDCLFGFSLHCLAVLSEIATLAGHSDGERILSDGSTNAAWRPSSSTVTTAYRLRSSLQRARPNAHKSCKHQHSAGDETYSQPNTDTVERNRGKDQHPAQTVDDDDLEMVAVNNAYHSAGLIHIQTRILGNPMSDPEVQSAVSKIVEALHQVGRSGTAEACMVFPMFTAGCAAVDHSQREIIMARMKSVEGFGMTQVRHARTLLQKVWESGSPWETLVSGEFVG